MSVSRKQLHDVSIQHCQQPDPTTGCMYFSYAALTGDRSLLKYQNDNSANRFLLRVQEAGYLLWPLYANRFEVCSLQFWKMLTSYLKSIHVVKLIATIDNEGQFHTVGIEAHFSEDTLIVSDPLEKQLVHFSKQEFVTSKYANAYEINVLDSGDIQDYHPIFSRAFAKHWD